MGNVGKGLRREIAFTLAILMVLMTVKGAIAPPPEYFKIAPENYSTGVRTEIDIEPIVVGEESVDSGDVEKRRGIMMGILTASGVVLLVLGFVAWRLSE